MIDTTDPKAVELALTYCQGKSIINSINLEDGEEKFERALPHRQSATARRWWWAPSTKTSCRRRPSRASANWPWRSAPYELLTREVRHPAGGHHHRPAGVPLRHRRRQLHRRRGGDHRRHPPGQGEHPVRQDGAGHFQHLASGCRPSAREVVNSVFLYYCTKAGLDLAIVNAEKLERFASHSRGGAAPGRAPAVQHAAGRCRRRGRCAPRRRTGAQQTRGTEGRHQPVPHRRHRRAFPRSRRARQAAAPRTCRSISAWPTTSSKAPRTAWSPTSTASAPKAPRRSTSSTAR